MIINYKTTQRFDCNYANSTYIANGQQITITIQAKDGYYFNLYSDLNRPYITIDINRIEFDTLSESECSVTLTTAGSQCTINGSASLPYCVNFNHLDYATCNLSNERIYKHNDVVDVVIRANDGYWFETPPTLTDVELTGNSEQTEYTGHVTFTKDIYLNATATVKPIEDKYGVCRIYSPTVDQLKQISQQRTYTFTGVGVETTQVDLGAFISNLCKVFIHLPATLKDMVVLGGYDTGVECDVVLHDVIITDCGDIVIKPHYDNIMDYNNTTIEMCLPFIGIVSIDTAKVMNRTIKLEYRTNVINGDTLACIYADGVLIQTHNCNVGYNIPYQMNNSVDKVISNVDIDAGFLHGFTPYVLIRRNKPNDETSLNNMATPDERYCQVKDLNGLIECMHVFNTLSITETERNMIDQLLQSGVIV